MSILTVVYRSHLKHVVPHTNTLVFKFLFFKMWLGKDFLNTSSYWLCLWFAVSCCCWLFIVWANWKLLRWHHETIECCVAWERLVKLLNVDVVCRCVTRREDGCSRESAVPAGVCADSRPWLPDSDVAVHLPRTTEGRRLRAGAGRQGGTYACCGSGMSAHPVWCAC